MQCLSLQVVKDTMLIGIVLALVLVNVLILVIWEAADPLGLKIKDLDKEASSINKMFLCKCSPGLGISLKQGGMFLLTRH